MKKILPLLATDIVSSFVKEDALNCYIIERIPLVSSENGYWRNIGAYKKFGAFCKPFHLFSVIVRLFENTLFCKTAIQSGCGD
jgi:hypothetical protein